MAKKKSKSFGKHIYALVAIIVLLVAAGIASYATAPAGAATHGTLYTNTIMSKDRPPAYQVVDVNDTLYGNKGVRGISNYNVGVAGISNLDATEAGGAVGVVGQATRTNGVGVKGENTISGNKGLLGTQISGVEGTSVIVGSMGFGVKGTSAASTTTSAGVYGESSGTSAAGVRGYATGSSDAAGVKGGTTSATSWAGWFFGGRGLYASKIEFGPDAFGIPTGALILGAAGTVICTNVCASHSLNCDLVYTVTGTPSTCGSTSGARYCWCD